MAEPPPGKPLRPLVQATLTGAWAGLAGGVIAAIGDAISATRRLRQFLPGLGARIGHGVFLAALYGLLGFVICAALGAAGWLFWRHTRAGALITRVRATLAARREADPLVAITMTAHVLAVLAALGIAWGISRKVALTFQLRFHNQGLIAAYIATVAIGAVVGALVFSLVIGRLLEVGLRAAARGPMRRPLASPWAALVLAVSAVVVIAIVGITVDYKSIKLLNLRPQAMAGLLALFAVAAAVAIHKLRLCQRAPRRPALIATVVALPVLFGLVVGLASDAVRKGAERYTGLGAPFLATLRRAFDFDRDGYSRILGGGDCNDWNKRIHPNATDIPDNGVDENCVGGDFSPASLGANLPFTPLLPAMPQRPNILLITIDTLRADHLGAYGYARPTSPNIDKLAATGTLFEAGFSNAPSTRYSMPAIMTGRWPSVVAWDSRCPFVGGCGDAWPPPISDSNHMLAESLKAHGYFTAALLNYRFFTPTWGLGQGFDLYDNGREYLHQGNTDPATHGSSSREQTDVAIDFLRARGSETFFLWVHYYDPHYFYEVHPEVTSFGSSNVDLYDGEIAFTDLHVGRLLDAVDALGLRDRTVVVLTGDHGEGFGEHGIDFHGYHLYPPQTKVPFIIRAPGAPPGRTREPVSHVDLMPTLLNLAGASPDPGTLGRSAVDLLVGAAPPAGAPPRAALQEVLYEPNVVRKALATGDWQLVYNMVPDNTWELYNLSTDRQATKDVSGQGGDAARAMGELRPRLERWVDLTQQLRRARK